MLAPKVGAGPICGPPKWGLRCHSSPLTPTLRTSQHIPFSASTLIRVGDIATRLEDGPHSPALGTGIALSNGLTAVDPALAKEIILERHNPSQGARNLTAVGF
jgi:hypothetical protein